MTNRICSEPGCKNCSAPNRKICYKHKIAKERQANPMVYHLNRLRNRAKTRKIPFTLTREQWEKFCVETDYVALAGHGGDNLTVDRKDPTKGYEEGNIQVLPFLANVIKGNKERALYREHYVGEPGIKREYRAYVRETDVDEYGEVRAF